MYMVLPEQIKEAKQIKEARTRFILAERTPLVSSAHRSDLDVWLYVNDVLEQLLAGTTDYEPLLPWNWAVSHPEAIRQYRVEERRERSVRRAAKRANRRKAKRFA
jgi:adenylate cyclase